MHTHTHLTLFKEGEIFKYTHTVNTVQSLEHTERYKERNSPIMLSSDCHTCTVPKYTHSS